MKFIYRIDYDPSRMSEGNPCDEFTVGGEYEDDETGNNHKVSSIEEVYSFGVRTFIVHFDDGKEFEITDMYHLYKKFISVT